MRHTPWSRLKSVLFDLLKSAQKRRGLGRHFVLFAEQLEPRLAPAAASPQLLASYGQLPLIFEPNEGQTAAQVQYLTRGSGYTLFLTPTSAVLDLEQAAAPSTNLPGAPRTPEPAHAMAQPEAPSTSVALTMSLIGANPRPSKRAAAQDLP